LLLTGTLIDYCPLEEAVARKSSTLPSAVFRSFEKRILFPTQMNEKVQAYLGLPERQISCSRNPDNQADQLSLLSDSALEVAESVGSWATCCMANRKC
jgi:hypothetical protein